MPPHPCVFVNEPKLLDLKMIFIRQHGLKAEFVNGVLICEDTVAIKRVCNRMDQAFSFVLQLIFIVIQLSFVE
jgi:hypothetical protein